VKKAGTLLVNMRYPWCSQCKSQDESFAKAARLAKAKARKDKLWKKVAFGVADAREERDLARRFGAKCDYDCEYKIVSDPRDEAISLKASWSDEELLKSLQKYLTPAVQVVKSAKELESTKLVNSTVLGGFASESDPKYSVFRRVANLMRGEAVFAAEIGAEKPVELWAVNQSTASSYEGTLEDNGTALLQWARPRVLPLLQEYDWQLREPYEKLGIPVAKVWIDHGANNTAFDKIVRHVVRKVAQKFLGRIAFVELKSSTYSYELKDFGLSSPEVFPSFGIASNNSYSAIKYGFEVEEPKTAQEFWSDSKGAIEKLSDFCEKVLAGSWPLAHETGPAHTNWTRGEVKRIAWKTFDEVRSPQTPMFLEVYGKYRMGHDDKAAEVRRIAKALEPLADNVIVASYDTSDNYAPP